MHTQLYDPGDFDLVVVVRDVPERRAVRTLSRIGRFRVTPYRGVIVGTLRREPGNTETPGTQYAQSALIAAVGRHPEAFTCVERLSPVDCVVSFERDDVTEALCSALEGRAGAVYGRSFHVRVRLRGLKGRLESQAVERALGGYLHELAESAGKPARVTFEDPDVIVMVQIVGCRAGFAFLGREVRALPLVRPR